MPEPLWKIRERKGMNINELAARSGVPAISISEYESGQAIRSADLPKLAKALYVEEWDIELKSAPKPKPQRRRAQAEPAAPPAAPTAEATEKPKKRKPAPARPTQIEHLVTLAEGHFGRDRAALAEEIGKPLEELTRNEASQILREYQETLAERSGERQEEEAGIKRKRAYLPEGVDAFEMEYLNAQQEAGTLLRFTLFDGQQISGRLIGYGAYSITIDEEETGEEITIQKLAIAYYRASNADDATPEEETAPREAGDGS